MPGDIFTAAEGIDLSQRFLQAIFAQESNSRLHGGANAFERHRFRRSHQPH
jgi:hypothetical protein